MKPDLSLVDSVRRLIDFAGASGNPAGQVVLASLLEDLAKAVEREPILVPANLADEPWGKPILFVHGHSSNAEPPRS